MTRRQFLASSGAALAASALPSVLDAAAPKPPVILLRSSWQTVNIGDIAHTPGVLALLEKYLPQAEIRLWPSSVDNGVEGLLRRRFPKLKLLLDDAAKSAALQEADFFLHGSGPMLVGINELELWRKQTAKPYGIYGITFSDRSPRTIDLMSGAAFAFFRDTVSLKFAQDHGVKSPIMDFGPDGAFAVDLANDAAAEAFLAANDLQTGRFLCCIPRLRNTPYWKIHARTMGEEDQRRHEVNEKMKEHDHAALRQAIVEVVRQTGMKVLVCPEDQSQMAVGKEMLVDPLPADVRGSVVWRENYWLTDEAISTYRRSAGLFGNEMHSPIMCIGNGIPAIVCRWNQQTSKGFMWRDIGLSDWLFDLEEESQIPGIVPAVLAIAKDPASAKQRALAARDRVRQHQQRTMTVLAKCLGTTPAT